jgi:hypothetical protein
MSEDASGDYPRVVKEKSTTKESAPLSFELPRQTRAFGATRVVSFLVSS